MKQFYYPFLAITMIAGLMSCGDSSKQDNSVNQLDQLKNTAEVLSNMDEIAEKMEKTENIGAQKRKERIEKGDTLALPYQDLQSFLPQLDGFEKVGEPNGQNLTMPGMSYSLCSQKYRNGDTEIEINITDFNAAGVMFNAAMAPYSAGITFEDNNQLLKSLEHSNELIDGVQLMKKKEKEASVILGVGYRFFVIITASNQENTDYVQEIMGTMNLDKLAEM